MIRCISPKRTAIRNGFPDHLISSAKIRNALSQTDLPTSPYHDIIRHVNKSTREWQIILYICNHCLIDFSDPPFLVSYLWDVTCNFHKEGIQYRYEAKGASCVHLFAAVLWFPEFISAKKYDREQPYGRKILLCAPAHRTGHGNVSLFPPPV